MSQAGDRLQGDVSLKSNTIMLDTLAKKSQDHKVRTLPPKKPKQNPQPTGRGRVKFQGQRLNFSGQSAHRGKGRGAKRAGTSPTFGRRRA